MLRTNPPHIPTEIMRTVVAINEAGSLSKAADRLGLSQPAVTAQIKKLQTLIGGEVFTRTANGTTPTELGKLVVQQARRMLDANDQLFYLGGARAGESTIRLGLSTLLAGKVLESRRSPTKDNVFIYADQSSVIRKGLIEGYIDVGCFFALKSGSLNADYTVVAEVDWSFQWVRARELVLSPGSPIPIITLPEDDWMIGPLLNNGLSFRIVFHSPDFFARLCAVRAGVGLGAMPTSFMPSDLVEAREYYLPKLPPVKAVLCTRQGIDQKKVADIVGALLTQLSEKALPPLNRVST